MKIANIKKNHAISLSSIILLIGIMISIVSAAVQYSVVIDGTCTVNGSTYGFELQGQSGTVITSYDFVLDRDTLSTEFITVDGSNILTLVNTGDVEAHLQWSYTAPQGVVIHVKLYPSGQEWLPLPATVQWDIGVGNTLQVQIYATVTASAAIGTNPMSITFDQVA